MIWNRSLIEMKSKRLGLVAKGVRRGDKVCVLYGCSVPVILRQCEEPKSAEQIREEKRYDLQEMIHGARKAAALRARKSERFRETYEAMSEEERNEISESKTKAVHDLTGEMDASVKAQMTDWLEAQRRVEVKNAQLSHQREGKSGLPPRRDRKEDENDYKAIIDDWFKKHKAGPIPKHAYVPPRENLNPTASRTTVQDLQPIEDSEVQERPVLRDSERYNFREKELEDLLEEL